MRFLHTPRSSAVRRWLFWIHLYAGLSAGVVTLLLGLSGALLVYSPEFELAPRWSGGPRPGHLPIDLLADRVTHAFPSFRLQDIRFDADGNATVFHIQAQGEHRRPGGDLHLVVDPSTGEILKTVDRRAGAWHWLREFHHNLLAGKRGRLVNGVIGLLLLALCLTGLVIWWPGVSLWRKRLTIQPGTGWKRLNWDLHSASGFWVAGMLAFLSLTGAQFAFPRAYEAVIRFVTFSPKAPPADLNVAAEGGTRPGIEALLSAARTAIPEGRVAMIKFPRNLVEPVEVRIKTAFDGHQDGNNKVYLHPSTAAVLSAQRFDELPIGGRLLATLGPAHMARFMTPGWASVAVRSLWVMAGIAPGLLFITGFLMWWNRVAGKKARRISLRLKPTRVLVRVAAAAGLLLLASFLARGGGLSLRGCVQDGTGAAIAEAKVTLQTAPERSQRTTRDCLFEFENVAPGLHTLLIEAAGFTPKLVQARLGAEVNVRLEPAPVVQTVEVNAGTFDQIRLDESVFQAGLTRADIATRNNRRLSDVVARMPGVFMTGPPGGDKDVRLRGLDKEFTRTQIDGVMIPDGGEKRELQLNRIPSSTVESVRIIRNPTAEFESDGLAGRVDVQTRPIPDRFHLDARAAYGARASNFANDVAQGQVSGGKRFNRRVGFFGTLDYLNDTLPIERGRLMSSRDLESESERQRQRSPNFFGDLGLFSDRLGELHIKPVVMQLDTRMAKLRQTHSSSGLLTKREDEAEQKTQRTLGTTLNHRYARSSGLILDSQAGWFQTTEDKDKWKLGYKVDGAGGFSPDKRTLEPEAKSDRVWTAASSAALPFTALLWHEVKLGGSFRTRSRVRDKDRFELAPGGALKYTGEAKDRYRLQEDYFAGFFQDRLRITERLSITPGVRFERVRLATASAGTPAAPRYFDDWNPSAHLLYRLARNWSVRAAVSRGLARPKFDELAPYENVTATKIVIGNPGLQPARAWNYDAGFDYATRLITFSVNGFRKSIRGVIEEVDTGLDRDGRDVYRVQNVGNGWTSGLEFEQRLRLPSTMPRWARILSFWSNQTVLASNLRAQNGMERPFKEQPRWIANIGADLSDERFGTSVSLMCNLVARRYDYKATGDVATFGGSSSLDLAVYQRIRGNWRFFLEGNNLSNRNRVQDEMFLNGTGTRRVETYGRTMLAGVQVSF